MGGAETFDQFVNHEQTHQIFINRVSDFEWVIYNIFLTSSSFENRFDFYLK